MKGGGDGEPKRKNRFVVVVRRNDAFKPSSSPSSFFQSSKALLSQCTERLRNPLPAARASGAPGAAATSRWRAAAPRTTASKPLMSSSPAPRPTSTTAILEQEEVEEQASVQTNSLCSAFFFFQRPRGRLSARSQASVTGALTRADKSRASENKGWDERALLSASRGGERSRCKGGGRVSSSLKKALVKKKRKCKSPRLTRASLSLFPLHSVLCLQKKKKLFFLSLSLPRLFSPPVSLLVKHSQSKKSKSARKQSLFCCCVVLFVLSLSLFPSLKKKKTPSKNHHLF